MHTVQNLKVMKVDAENGIVVVHGAVPGPRYGVVKIQDAIKKPWPEVDAAVGFAVHEGVKNLLAKESRDYATKAESIEN